MTDWSIPVHLKNIQGREEFIRIILGFQLSGETHAMHAQGNTIVPEGSVVLVRKKKSIDPFNKISFEGR